MVYFLVLFLISALLLGTVYIGPLSVRVYSTVLMIIVLTFFKGFSLKQVLRQDILLRNYIVFLFIMGISLVVSGEFESFGYIKRFLAYYLVCIVAYCSVSCISHDKKYLKVVLWVLCLILLFDIIVTILQYQGNLIGWAIGSIFEDISEQKLFIDEHGGLAIGMSRIPGVFGSTVTNAFLLTVVSPLFLYLGSFYNNLILKYGCMFLYVLGFVSCYMTQQRAAFGLFIISSACFVFNQYKQKPWLIIITVILLLVLGSYLESTILNIDYGRLLSTENEDRDSLAGKAIGYIVYNFWWGGPMAYRKIAGLDSAHNVLLDSWITAGVFGFISMCLLFFRSITYGIKSLIRSVKKDTNSIYPATSFLLIMAYGLVHNTSYLSGDCIIFIILSILNLSIHLNNLKNENSIN